MPCPRRTYDIPLSCCDAKGLDCPSYLIYTVWPCFIHTCLAMPMPRPFRAPTMPFWKPLHGVAGERHGKGMLCVKMDAQDTILDDITRKQLIWYGHVERVDATRLPKILINWKPEVRKKRGRPQRTWREGIYTAMSERDLRMCEWNNRRQWNMDVGRRRQTF
jgi:hypothetical protein